ncbi:NAD-binding protein [Fomitiporia mediterranea MF3/22]|uniref:NAD-binding protein n=1 Tax=Fomitiporia mediterranea (strain MF3/22) TaxID=694068 RepID=UPI0004407D45|nr:NAD-binding protein [Fomitiporia mediterranea MF3/22]EJD05566.1 NAD-binding protein [Fomitiporia mediterranea MF3/22]
MARQSVLLIGATGQTGASVLDGLLESGNFTVVAGVRPPSASKPEVQALKARGIEVRILDIVNWTVEQLVEPLKGINIVISTIYVADIQHQKRLADACKKIGVKRLVPNDWATPCVRGLRGLHDEKLAVHDYIKEIRIGYTFIDVGWWMEGILPYEAEHPKVPGLSEFLRTFFGEGNVKCAITDRRDIGKFVARILADERTLNHYVFCWTQQATQSEAFALAERVSGRKVDRINVSAEQLAQRLENASGHIERIILGYADSVWIRGDNTIENAKKEEYGGALDARELYPDLGKELRSLESWAREIYSS